MSITRTSTGLVFAATSLLGGCATSWVVSQAKGNPQIWDEGAKSERVPQPGPREVFAVVLPLTVDRPAVPAPTTEPTPAGVPSPSVAAAALAAEPLPLRLQCGVKQHGVDTLYRASTRYGRTWKKGTAIAAALEAATSAILLLAIPDDDPNYLGYTLTGGFLGVDALVSAALFFLPRQERYESSEVPTETGIRNDCPEGLQLVVGDERFDVDAAGKIGEFGELALAEWMTTPSTPLAVTLGELRLELPVGRPEQCAWHQHHGTAAPAGCLMLAEPPRRVVASAEVPLGALSRAP
ncbi:MAG: hypothetical protein R2939_07715 [Kofleriaceae bacterium]